MRGMNSITGVDPKVAKVVLRRVYGATPWGLDNLQCWALWLRNWFGYGLENQ